MVDGIDGRDQNQGMVRFNSVSLAVAAGSPVLAFLTVLAGASLGYAAAQLTAMIGFAALIWLAPQLPFAVALILITTVAKNFAISQVVKALLWQPADVGMAAPVATIWVIAAGTWGLVLAAAAYSRLRPPETWTTPLSAPVSAATLTTTGWVLFVGGAICKFIFSKDSTLPVIFSYSGDLIYAAAAAFAYDVWRRSNHSKILDHRVLLVLGTILLIALQTSSKFGVLAPFVLLFLLYLGFKIAPPLSLVAPVVVLFVFLSFLIYPVANYARAFSGGNAGIAKVLGDTISDPQHFSEIEMQGERISLGWNNRLYYKKTMNILDRFTPNQIADVVSVEEYTRFELAPYLRDALTGVLPQSFGFHRNQLSLGQARLETAVQRRAVNGANSANYGLFADLRLHGGLLTVFLGSAAVGALVLVIYTIGFGGQRNDIWALSWGVGGMFSIADQSLGANLIAMVHGAIIEWGIILAVVTYVSQSGRIGRTFGRRARPGYSPNRAGWNRSAPQ
jgi:hypothetical protein